MIRNVLVVDDSQVDRNRLEKLVSDAGYLVVSATNGAQALEMAKRAKPDLVFMDVNMPEMDGFATTRGLRNDPATKDIPVVMVTAKDQKADKAWGQMLGAKGYITKNEASAEVARAIRCDMNGDVYASTQMTARLLERMTQKRSSPEITGMETLADRELEVFQMLGRG